MVVPPGRPADAVIADYRAAIEESDRHIAIGETSEVIRHVGHADILREQIDGATGR